MEGEANISGSGDGSDDQDMPHAHEGSDRPGPQVGVGTGGLGGQEWSGRREESSGQGDAPSDEDSADAGVSQAD